MSPHRGVNQVPRLRAETHFGVQARAFARGAPQRFYLFTDGILYDVSNLLAVLLRQFPGWPLDHDAAHIFSPRITHENPAIVAELRLYLFDHLYDLRQ